MAKHIPRDELIRQLKYTSKMNKNATRVSFTTMSILCNYILWKCEGLGQRRLSDYNKRVYDYWQGEEKLEKWNSRLEGKAGFPVTVAYMTASDNPYKKTKKYRHAMENILMDAENEILRIRQKYTLIHFNVLMDLGYGKVRLNRNREDISSQIQKFGEEEEATARYMAYELETKVGILFEMP